MSEYNKNYAYNPNSALFSVEEDDVDDDTFLQNSRKPASNQQNPSFQQLTARRHDIESRTLASTQRSLSILRESEQVGVATAQELADQREKLERTSRNLDAINATLRSTQRNIDGMKSVFTSLKNYFTGPKENKELPKLVKADQASCENWSNEYVSRVPSTPSTKLQQQRPPPRTAQEAIDTNLDIMSGNIGQLKGLALNLGDEIMEQNELLDSMQDKTERAEFTIGRQNQQISRLLGKK